MPINLLQHKSYHVYNAKNIERVRRDEETARQEKKQQEQEANAQERAHRIEALRINAGLSAAAANSSSSSSLSTNTKRVKHQQGSTSRDAAVKEEDTFGKFARQNQTWYLDASKEPHKQTATRRPNNDRVATPLLRDPEDPLHTMKFFLSQKRKMHDKEGGAEKEGGRRPPTRVTKSGHHHHHHHRRHRRHRHQEEGQN